VYIYVCTVDALYEIQSGKGKGYDVNWSVQFRNLLSAILYP